ncbi:MAG: hypothetical protein ACK4UO_08020 [Pseudolabrys sp.]
MRRASRLPKRIPAGTKYVLESHGGSVRRYLELPDGRKVRLATRKAQVCNCLAFQQEVSIVPAIEEPARKRMTARRRTRVRALERA